MMNHRHKVVAHVSAYLDLETFDKENSLRTSEAWEVVEDARQCLGTIQDCLGLERFPLDDVKEMALEDAQASLSMYVRGQNELLRHALADIATGNAIGAQ